MSDKKSTFKIIKELWKNPKTHALMVLGIYAFFFAIVIIYIQIGSSIKNTEPNINNNYSSLDNLNNMKTYEYKYLITKVTNETNIINVEGIKYNNQNSFKILNDNQTYYIEDDLIKPNDLFPDDLYLLEIEPNKIYEYILANDKYSEIEYSDGSKKIEYLISLNDIKTELDIYEQLNDDQIKITTYEEDNVIYKIELNLSEYVKLKNEEINNYNIEINYTNINKISNYKVEQ